MARDGVGVPAADHRLFPVAGRHRLDDRADLEGARLVRHHEVPIVVFGRQVEIRRFRRGRGSDALVGLQRKHKEMRLLARHGANRYREGQEVNPPLERFRTRPIAPDRGSLR